MAEKIVFSLHELKHSWEEWKKIDNKDERARLLIKFYAVECGLKALYMERHRCKFTNDRDIADLIDKYRHDVNKIIIELKGGADLLLKSCQLKKIYEGWDNRTVSVGELNQMWRYGGKPLASTKNYSSKFDYERAIDKINKWIEDKFNN